MQDFTSPQNEETVGLKTEELTINMGPQHPSTHGVLRLQIHSDGEVIRAAYPDIGYLHRCFEKHSESREYVQVIPFTDRMDYIAAMSQELGYVLAVEKLLGFEAPERAQGIRVIVCELQRIASHLLAVATYGLDMGGFAPFINAFRDREHVLRLFEEICGARLLYNYIRPGGVSRDLSPGVLDKIKDFVKYLKPCLDEFNELLTYNSIFVSRTTNVGIVTGEAAISYGFSGPNLRGSGIDVDIRRDAPYSGYDKYEFDVCVGLAERGTVGDCWNRYFVRVKEMYQSLRIISQAVEALPAGDAMGKVAKSPKPVGEIYMETECPRGNLGYHIVADGSKKPWRVKAKSPCFIATSSLDEMCRGMMIADVVSYLGSIDIVLGEVDR
jgi:NADH-quinone oxidoreductase subunit D